LAAFPKKSIIDGRTLQTYKHKEYQVPNTALPVNDNTQILCYTDGSYSPVHATGGWAALVFIDNVKYSLSGIKANESHNRMEMTAVIEAVEFAVQKAGVHAKISVFTDSQYVVRIPARMDKLKANAFITSKGKQLPNADLILKLSQLYEQYNIAFVKVKAHQKRGETINYNREVDKMLRKLIRKLSDL